MPKEVRPRLIPIRSEGKSKAIIFIHGFGGSADIRWGEFPAYWQINFANLQNSPSIHVYIATAISQDAKARALKYR